MKLLLIVLGLVITVLLGMAGTFLLIDDATLASYVVDKAESDTATKITHHDNISITRTLTPTLKTTNLLIEDKDQSFRFKTDTIELQASLIKLMLGKLDILKLHLGNTQFETLNGARDHEGDSANDTGQSEPPTTSSSLIPSIDDLRIARLTIMQDGSELQLPEIGIDELDLKVDTSTTPVHISGHITLRSSTLSELATTAEGEEKSAKKTGGPVFSRTPLSFDWVDKVRLDLVVTAKPAESTQSNLKSAKFEIAVEPGKFSIEPATLVYPKGHLEFTLHIVTKDRPRIRLRASGKDLNPWKTLHLESSSEEFKTDLDIYIDIESSGNSPHQLAANASGNVSMVMKNGKIRRNLLDLLFVDIVGWTMGQSTKDHYTEIECGLADFSINQGVMTTRAFFMEGANIAITGDGTVDLGLEQIDYVFLPKKKTQFISTAAPVKVHGSLSSPAVTTLPWKSAAKEYGALAFAPQIFIPVRAVQHLFGKFMNPETETVSPCIQYQESQELGN